MNKELETMKVHGSINDLMTFVRYHGIEASDIETTNKIADIIGNCPIDELATIANKDANQFFFILRYVWPMIDVIRFYNDHCNKEIAALRQQSDTDGETIMELEKQLRVEKESHKTTRGLKEHNAQKLNNALIRQEELIDNNNAIQDKLYQQSEEIKKHLQEINELKAKMFDMMSQ